MAASAGAATGILAGRMKDGDKAGAAKDPRKKINRKGSLATEEFEAAARWLALDFPMHSPPDRRHRRPRSCPSPDKPRSGKRKPGRVGQTGGRRPRRARGLNPGELLAHVCEVLRLFPDAGNQAVAEMIGRLKREKEARAAAVTVRPVGRGRKPKRRARRRE